MGPADGPPLPPMQPLEDTSANSSVLEDDQTMEVGDAGLTARAAQDEVLIEALAAGVSFSDAGAVGNVTARTVSRRMADPAFAGRVSRRRGERVAQVTGALISLSSDALVVLGDCMAEGRPAERLRAAQLTLTLMARLRHDVEIEERLARLEGTLAGKGGEN